MAFLNCTSWSLRYLWKIDPPMELTNVFFFSYLNPFITLSFFFLNRNNFLWGDPELLPLATQQQCSCQSVHHNKGSDSLNRLFLNAWTSWKKHRGESAHMHDAEWYNFLQTHEMNSRLFQRWSFTHVLALHLYIHLEPNDSSARYELIRYSNSDFKYSFRCILCASTASVNPEDLWF